MSLSYQWDKIELVKENNDNLDKDEAKLVECQSSELRESCMGVHYVLRLLSLDWTFSIIKWQNVKEAN